MINYKCTYRKYTRAGKCSTNFCEFQPDLHISITDPKKNPPKNPHPFLFVKSFSCMLFIDKTFVGKSWMGLNGLGHLIQPFHQQELEQDLPKKKIELKPLNLNEMQIKKK